MRKISAIILMIFVSSLYGQEMTQKGSSSGIFSLGARSSIGLVNDGVWQKPAFGTGGQFRLQFGDWVNTEWFADYLTADLADKAWRADLHIGWSVLFYPLKNPKSMIQPFILAGHCFEYLKFTENYNTDNYAERWSSSVQGGLGTHVNHTPRLDLSLTAQYMVHFGTKILVSENDYGAIAFRKVSGSGIHDHILLNLSVNYKIVDLW
jgi:hypothetical protein